MHAISLLVKESALISKKLIKRGADIDAGYEQDAN